MRFSIGAVRGKIGGYGIDLLAELQVDGVDPLAEFQVNGIDPLAEFQVDGIDLLIQGAKLQIYQIEAFVSLAAKFSDLTAKYFMPFQNQIELAADIFEYDF
jgi:hypothetical protein